VAQRRGDAVHAVFHVGVGHEGADDAEPSTTIQHSVNASISSESATEMRPLPWLPIPVTGQLSRPVNIESTLLINEITSKIFAWGFSQSTQLDDILHSATAMRRRRRRRNLGVQLTE